MIETPLPDLVALVRQGDCIGWSAAGAEPTTLLRLLNASLDRLPLVTGLASVGLSTELDPARVAGRMRVKALGGASTNRRFQDVGALDVIPVHYGALPDLVRDGLLRVDIVLLTLAAGDGAALHLTPQVCYLADALPKARLVIGEINEQAPVLCGETAIDTAHIDHIVQTSRPLITMRESRPGTVEATIGANVARLVPDGATLEVGLGVLPDAVLDALTGKKDLGVHSGTIGDRVATLMEAGVITNRRKPIDTGLTITAGLLGTERLYRFAHRNRLIELRSPRYTHDNRVHADIPNFIAINTALEVDLTGQINAEVVGGRHLGMIGGHADFSRGALRSQGGKGIVTLASTAKAGSVSAIVPKFADGIVTTSRGDADIVVTEWGIAELRGRTVSERAKALIAIAHPDFRKSLAAATEGLI